MHRKIIEDLLQKLFDGTCTTEEITQLMEAIDKDPSVVGPDEMLKIFDQLQSDNYPLTPDYDLIRHNIFTAINESHTGDISIQHTSSNIPQKQHLLTWGYRLAASVAIILVFGYVLHYIIYQRDKITKTDFGEIKNIELPDGSLVSLNGNSSIRYAQHWSEGKTRRVYLEGEAFFDVKKNPISDTRFQVITGGLTIEVLGTSFNVKQRLDQTSVYLEEGTVKVNVAEKNQIGEDVILKPGEYVQYSSTFGEISVPTRVLGSTQTSWKEGMLEFIEKSVLDILNELSEANDIQFKIEDRELLDERLTISIPTKDMDIAMSVLGKTSGISITKENETFILSKKSHANE